MSSFARLVHLGCLVALLGVGPWLSPSQAGQVQTSTGKGLSLTVDSSWAPGGGYQHVLLTVAPLVPSPSDRTLEIRFFMSRNLTSRNLGSDDYDQQVVQVIELPAGSGPVRASVAIPQNTGGLWQIQVVEDHREIKSLTQSWSTQNGNGSGTGTPPLPQVLVISESPRNLDQLRQSLREAAEASYEEGHMLFPVSVSSSNSDEFIQTVTSAELPSRWIDYSNYDLIVVAMDQLQQLQQTRPEAHRALVRWAAAGGNLLVLGVGSSWQRLAELERFTDLAAQDETASEPTARGWLAPSRPERPLRFVYRPLGVGTCVAWAGDEIDPGRRCPWHLPRPLLGPARLHWNVRHGLVMYGENPDFWNFLIPGVGLAPVGMFRVLISLFVVLIGPVNYLLLRRWRRLYLLLVTVPLCALLVTGLLFTYAIFSDGFSSRVRVRSYTWLDQRHGEAVCWSRLSYYAGLSPARGLTFSPNVVVLPLTYGWNEKNGTGRETLWEDDQRLARGWLAARTPTQFVTVRAAASQRRLLLEPVADDATSLKVENRLGTRIEQLLVRGAGDQYYWAGPLEPGARGIAQAIKRDDGLGRLATAVGKHYPLRPAMLGASPASGQRRVTTWSQPNLAREVGSHWNSRLEVSLRSLDVNAGGSGPEPGQFVAVVAASPEVELGLPSAREEASFHMIQGTW